MTTPQVIAVNISAGGIPKLPLSVADVNSDGLLGDFHAHLKHIRPDRAVSLLDYEIILALSREGFLVWPGRMGENLTVVGTDVQHMSPGTELTIDEVTLRLEAPRKPCYVLDAIDPRLKDAAVGRCGYMASVVRGGSIMPGAAVRIQALV